MSETAEAIAAEQTSGRNITIEIINISKDYCLLDPKVYLESGSCSSPPQPVVRSLKTEVCTFTKDSGKSTGAVGVLTYDVYKGRDKVREKIAIMFSVPYDYNFYQNWAAVGTFSSDRETDEKLYKEMYYDKNPQTFVREEAHGSCIMYEGKEVLVMCTMSPLGGAIMKVEVWDKSYFHKQSQRPY